MLMFQLYSCLRSFPGCAEELCFPRRGRLTELGVRAGCPGRLSPGQAEPHCATAAPPLLPRPDTSASGSPNPSAATTAAAAALGNRHVSLAARECPRGSVQLRGAMELLCRRHSSRNQWAGDRTVPDISRAASDRRTSGARPASFTTQRRVAAARRPVARQAAGRSTQSASKADYEVISTDRLSKPINAPGFPGRGTPNALASLLNQGLMTGAWAA